MTRPVYVDPELTDVTPGALLRLSGDEARHAATVRRTRVGEQIDVVNAQGLRATITVSDVSKTELAGTVDAVVQDQPHTHASRW